MGDAERLLFANEAFYAAFASADMAAMRSLWSREFPVSVVHPGAVAVTGYDHVLESWGAILGGVDRFDIAFRKPVACLWGETGSVICYEKVGAHSLIATNVFAREGDQWSMLHHQSGPSPVWPDADSAARDPVH